MVILNVIKVVIVVGFGFSLIGCLNTTQCSTIGSGVTIFDWKGSLPSTAVLYQYEKRSNFTNLMKSSNPHDFQIDFAITPSSGHKSLSINFGGFGELPIGTDLKVVLDGKTQYKISNLVSTNHSNWGCPLESGLVNQCAIHGRGLSFPMSCGEPVKQLMTSS